MSDYRLRWSTVVSIACCCFASASYATTVLALRTNDQLIVAADSKFGSVEGPEAWGCKIRVSPNHIFAAAGILNRGPFDVYLIAGQFVFGGSDHASMVAGYEKEMMRSIPPVVAEIRRVSPRYYESKVRGFSAFQALFATAENGVIKLSYIAFRVNNINDISVIRLDCPGACDSTNPSFFGLGNHDAVDAELSKNPKIWLSLGFDGAMNRLMKLQSIATPETAEPTSIVTMLPNGRIEWIQRGQC